MTDAEFRDLFKENQDAVYRFAWRMSGSPSVAEDIAQEVFLTLLRQPGRFDPSRGPLRPFLLAIARNLALKRWREEYRWDELEDQVPAAPVDLERAEASDAVAAAVVSLPPLQREVLILAEYEELPLEEIARTVEAEVGTVKSRLHRARENLRRTLAPLRTKKTEKPITHGTAR